MTKLKTFIAPAILLGGVWFSIWLWYMGALAINNYARNEGLSGLPPITHWFIMASRYGITIIAGVIVSALIILTTYRKENIFRHALSLSLVLMMAFSSLGFAIFTLYIGSCLCDGWERWERNGHPTKIKNTSSNVVPSAVKAVQD